MRDFKFFQWTLFLPNILFLGLCLYLTTVVVALLCHIKEIK